MTQFPVSISWSRDCTCESLNKWKNGITCNMFGKRQVWKKWEKASLRTQWNGLMWQPKDWFYFLEENHWRILNAAADFHHCSVRWWISQQYVEKNGMGEIRGRVTHLVNEITKMSYCWNAEKEVESILEKEHRCWQRSIRSGRKRIEVEMNLLLQSLLSPKRCIGKEFSFTTSPLPPIVLGGK